MAFKAPLITVFSKCPDQIAVELKPHLQNLGVESFRCFIPDDMDKVASSPNEVMIIDFVTMLSTKSYDDILRLISTCPTLGLLSQEEIELRSRRAEACSEVIVWPRDLEELEVKVRQLCRLVANRINLAKSLALELNLVGESNAFQKVIANVKKYSKCDAPVLILGETGTGKEMIARAIHYVGLADDTPFVSINCGAIPDSLIENELFGHAKGAYTDARKSQRGLVEQAEGGTLFLDEIEALSLKGQVTLLRFLQDFEYRPLGALQCRHARLRLITASNEPLEELVERGLFRKDLFYRINILPLHLPPLRERGEDIALLGEHFVNKFRILYKQDEKYLDSDTVVWMEQYDWPGNVRELENLILREFLLADSSCVSIKPINGRVGERRKNMRDRRWQTLYSREFQEAKSIVVTEFERSYLKYVLDDAKGNISQAARQAGKERRTFAKLLEKHGVVKKRVL